MKAKTLKLVVVLLITAGIFTACNGKEYPFLNIDETTITATAEGEVFTISVSSNGEWTAVVQDAENNLWLTLTNTSGVNDGVITVNIAENPYFTARSATLKISMGSLSEIVIVEQEAAEVIFPIEIPFTEISLANTGCRWTTVPALAELFIINSKEELEKYIACADGSTFPEIDFANYTLLLTSGTTPHSPAFIDSIGFLKTAVGKYVLTVKIGFGALAIPGVWRAAILVPKIPNDADIERIVHRY